MNDAYFMRMALHQATLAYDKNEVPVGAVVVYQGKVIGQGHNLVMSLGDPTAHAEMIALREASKTMANYRLNGAVLYTTLEPCAMCAGAVFHSRIERVVFGASDEKFGVVHSAHCLFEVPVLNPHCRVSSGVLATPCADILHDFFVRRRKAKATEGK